MKKLFFTLFLAFILSANNHVNALNYEQAYKMSNKKPCVVFIYANWIDNFDTYATSVLSAKNKFGNYYNFVSLDIGSKDAKFFNSKYQISTNLPYIIIQRDLGKITRHVQRDCLKDTSCLASKLKAFLQ